MVCNEKRVWRVARARARVSHKLSNSLIKLVIAGNVTLLLVFDRLFIIVSDHLHCRDFHNENIIKTLVVCSVFNM